MDTGYWIQDHFIWLTESAKFWIQDGRIYGPRNSGQYWIEGKHIWGPRNGGQFWVDDNGHIFGPSPTLPWLE